MIERSVLIHYRTEEAKAFRRKHGDRGGGRYPDNPTGGRYCQRLEINCEGTTNALTSVNKDNMVYIIYD